MIVVKIQGGLGNQLFQYALALALKKRAVNQTICIDKSFYKINSKEITFRESLDSEINIENFKEGRIADTLKKNSLKGIIAYLIKDYSTVLVNEKSQTFHPEILNLKKNAYLIGYWQSYKYFEGIEDEIRKQFTIKNPLSTNALKVQTNILSKPVSVSIHIRRGDYLSKYSAIYNQLNIEYYEKGLALIKNKLEQENISVFVFSDDIEWCKSNIKLNYDTFFVEQTNSISEDLFLMSSCTHNIIANSSFSWWAAWLNKKLNKIVVAPNKWYLNQEPNFNTSIYPAEWTII